MRTFACGGPYSTIAGAEPVMKHDLTRARQLGKESGYGGRPVVVLHVTDIPFLNAAAIVTPTAGVDRLQGHPQGDGLVNHLVARTHKEPPDKGGWNLLFTWWLAADVIIPPYTSACRARAQCLVRLAGRPAARETHHRLGACWR